MENPIEKLFWQIFLAKDEEELHEIIQFHSDVFADSNWKALGDNFSNYGIVKNQQSNPIAALIEKATNSIDAILTKRCKELGINPESAEAPQTMDEAILKFFPNNNWDIPTFRRKQAEEIQIIADGKGPRTKAQYPTSVIIYDNGEGQHPQDFPKTFLSLVSGNKNKVQFVQGKYNMGGSGAIVFCGKKRYQLIGSRKYDKSDDFGFTLVREHPKRDEDQSKETWYEYFTMDGKIPSFPITQLDLGLENRKFETGSIIKMYSYQFPKGYSGFAQDVRQSINEFLFDPALPMLTKDTAERYPNNNVLVADLYGLKRRLYNDDSGYIEYKFSEDFKDDDLFGEMKVTCFVFKTKVKDNDMKATKENIDRNYFKNGMNVLFSMNGQVHGHYTSEFITRSLKMNLLKNYLLIHVDCTKMKYDFRKELFMASRDRLKDGEETQALRHYLSNKLSRKDGRLTEILNERKQAGDIDTSANTDDLLRNFTKNMAFDPELVKLLGQTFKLDLKKEEKSKQDGKPKTNKEQEERPFHPNRFPTLFELSVKNDGETEVSKIPKGGEKAIKFQSDVVDDYFDRTDEPGDLQIAVLNIKRNETTGGTEPGTDLTVEEFFNVNKSSPNKGTIKINLNPKDSLQVGDTLQMKVSLTAPGKDLEELFWVKIIDEQQPKEKAPKQEIENEPLGLPQMVFTYEEVPEGMESAVTWDAASDATGFDISFETTMAPATSGDNLEKVFINMDSSVLKKFKAKNKNPNGEQLELANRKYYSSVYFHTLFLYTITKNRGYQLQQKKTQNEEYEDVDLGQYLRDVFDNYYSTFILNFGGAEEMMQGLGE